MFSLLYMSVISSKIKLNVSQYLQIEVDIFIARMLVECNNNSLECTEIMFLTGVTHFLVSFSFITVQTKPLSGTSAEPSRHIYHLQRFH